MRRKGTAWETAHCMVPSFGVHRKAFDTTPESAGGVVARQAGVRVDVADDVDGIGRGAEAEHLCVEADRNVDVVFAGQEEQCVSGCTEFAVLLDGIDLVDLSLDVCGGHRGIEEQNVGAEVGMRVYLGR